MSSHGSARRIAATGLVVWLGACSPGADVANVSETSLAASGSACVTSAPTDGRLCFEYDAGVVTLVAAGLLPDSTMTITGANGDSAAFDVGSDATVNVQVGDRLVLAPFTAAGQWGNGEPAVLTVDGAD